MISLVPGAQPAPERAGGNGSLMRILPLALVEREAPARALSGSTACATATSSRR
jgi:ADP-ribosylglycohydrolase